MECGLHPTGNMDTFFSMRPFWISSLSTPRPRYSASQTVGIQWLAEAHTHAENKRSQQRGERFHPTEFNHTMKRLIERFGAKPHQVSERGFELEDFQHQPGSPDSRVFTETSPPEGADSSVRMKFYSERVYEKLSEVFANTNDAPKNLMHVSCTGYVSPSPAQRLVSERGWNTTTTHLYHMGCYAAWPALRMASAVSRETSAPVSVFHSELCTLHLNPAIHEPEQLLVQSLFADGYAAYQVSGEKTTNADFEVLAIDECILPNSLDAMTWAISPWGLKMGISRNVPNTIGKEIKNTLERFASGTGFDWRDETSIYAIHPGGPKIIDQISEALVLKETQVAKSREVLFRFGNMSSATTPTVWKLVRDDASIASGTLVWSMAFGPGLTCCLALLRKC